MKKALITGITGQDGSYLAELLINKGYDVYGIIRRSSSFNTSRINHLYEDSHSSTKKLNLIYGDLSDSSSIRETILKVAPNEIYHLGAQSHVRTSFDIPEYTANINALGTLRILESIKSSKMEKEIKFYQASTSELFGKVQEIPQNEKTPFYPRSPYGFSKLFAFWAAKNYKEAEGIFACNGILFNHESPRRGETFVTRKITLGLSRIKLGLEDKIYLGNLNAERDWGFAGDFVEAMWLMLQQEKPEDYVIGTGEKHSVREFLEETAKNLDMKVYSNKKQGIEEKYYDENEKEIIEIDSRYFRPTEVDLLLADPSKAKKELGWEPKIKFKELVKMMTEADLKIAEVEAYVKKRKK